ncbi:MAG: DUF2283 domain-containing protein [Candidatus Omnitrophota bacterium]
MKDRIVSIQAGGAKFFSFDTMAKAIYIGFSNNPVEKTVRKNSSLFFDYDKNGKLVGIEIIRIKKSNITIKKILKDAERNLPATIRKTIDNYLEPVSA